MANNEQSQPLSLRFRSALVQRLAATLRAGECCSVVGVAGVGKTNLAHFFLRADVQQQHWGDTPVWPVLIDSNALVTPERPDEFGILELVIHRLIRSAEEHHLPSAHIAELDRLHTSLTAQPNTLLGFRYLERILGRIFAQEHVQIVLVFDQFDDFWQTLPPRLFLNLRYLRDEFKYRLVYLTFTRERLQRMRQRVLQDAAAVESFWEIFDPHIFGLGAYDEPDATDAVMRITQRYGQEIDDAMRLAAIQVSGGHPALLRAIVWHMLHRDTQGEWSPSLLTPAIASECEKIWRDLPGDEQQLVHKLAHGDVAVSSDLDELYLKGLVVEKPAKLFSPVFATYLRQLGEDNVEGITVDVPRHRVLVNGQELKGSLSPLEFRLLAYLARHAGQVCPRDDLIQALYPGEHNDASDERIDTLLARLREALGEAGRNPRHLITHRGVGVRLVKGHMLE